MAKHMYSYNSLNILYGMAVGLANTIRAQGLCHQVEVCLQMPCKAYATYYILVYSYDDPQC